ncbi:MAG: FprA family A-type flavoprotein [bacterium]
MFKREISEGVYFLPSIDWDRRLFDSLIPLPDGTSYNAFFIEGAERTALLDTSDPRMREEFLTALKGIKRVDYLVAHHGEQDHSGLVPEVMELYPESKLLVSAKGKEILMVHHRIPEDRIQVVGDGETLNLGGKTLEFIYTPWVHWPETMVTYLKENRILFTCDFFGSHLATSDVFTLGDEHSLDGAKRYFAEIMMPFRATILKNIEKLSALPLALIAPSHGPLWDKPEVIMGKYKEWSSETPQNIVLLPFVSMHDSTRLMVNYFTDALIKRGIKVERFEVPQTDLGKIAMALVDACTLVLGTPTVLAGAHPYAAFAAFLANALRPKLRYISLIGSFGWGGKTVEQVSALLSNLKAEVLTPVMAKGLPREEDFQALDHLADQIKERHQKEGLL